MSPELPGALIREGLLLLASVGGPVFGALLVMGLVLGILQSATQINDSAVGFVPRLVAGMLVVWGLGGWMVHRMAGFLIHSLTLMAGR
ncbi:MAG TPA: flagellar biosynthetic protein FliQ [Anaeromyxobacter sp.]|nr:flagellar biosynthetic protein FliQ [Anaeromyxobacter sp.]